MSARGGVPECKGVGRVVARRKSKMSLPRERMFACPECGRTVPINYDGSLRWHTPNPKRGR